MKSSRSLSIRKILPIFAGYINLFLCRTSITFWFLVTLNAPYIPHDGYFGPPWRIELTEPSCGHPVAYQPDGLEPRRFKGYKWFRCEDRARYIKPMTYHWELFRMHDAPKDDKEVWRVFPEIATWGWDQ